MPKVNSQDSETTPWPCSKWLINKTLKIHLSSRVCSFNFEQIQHSKLAHVLSGNVLYKVGSKTMLNSQVRSWMDIFTATSRLRSLVKVFISATHKYNIYIFLFWNLISHNESSFKKISWKKKKKKNHDIQNNEIL